MFDKRKVEGETGLYTKNWLMIKKGFFSIFSFI
jgi:hypothetical protein